MLKRRPGFDRMRRCLFLALLIVSLILSAELRAQPVPQQEITVSAAISLKDALETIAKNFKAMPQGGKVIYNFGASGDLARQIEAGAPVDVFASAAQKDMDDIETKGLVVPNSRRNFAANSVVLIKPGNSNLPLQSINDLQKPEIKKIVIGNPKTVPAGRYAEEALKYFKLWDSIKDKLIFAENVRQVLDYVVRNEVDAGLVYSTDAMVRSKEVKIVLTLPENSHQPVIYPIALLKNAKNESLAKRFVDFVVSSESQGILSKFGFKPVKK
jgi:molybdate transport system substrate-binding protein